jgi:hypothetical protein
MTLIVTRVLWTVFCIEVSIPVVHGAHPLARCYLMGWDTRTRVALLPEQVRQWADVRCAIYSATEVAELKTILQLDRISHDGLIIGCGGRPGPTRRPAGALTGTASIYLWARRTSCVKC